MKRTIKLTESDLNKIVTNSVKQILREQMQLPTSTNTQRAASALSRAASVVRNVRNSSVGQAAARSKQLNSPENVQYLCKCVVHMAYVNKERYTKVQLYNKMIAYLKEKGVDVTNKNTLGIVNNLATYYFNKSMQAQAYTNYQNQAQNAYNNYQMDSLRTAQQMNLARIKQGTGNYTYR